jgi:putative FmdB family regulatory protein
MPTYDYRCELCGHEFEEFQSMKDELLVVCPKCKKEGLKRLIGSGSGMIFKGSGFYLTDYKGGNASNKPAQAKNEKPSETKTEAKKSESDSASPASPSPSK